MSNFKKLNLSLILCISIVILLLSPAIPTLSVNADSIQFVILSDYHANVQVGDEFYIVAITTNGDMPSWKSSSSKIAAVNAYGKVTAKKPGTVTITAKIKKGEASCQVTVKKTMITLSDATLSLERGETKRLTASTSNHSAVTWKSTKKSIATIDDNGVVTGIKPGETIITATADGTDHTCKVKVKYPTVKLNRTKAKLYRGQTMMLTASVSSSITPTWKSNKKSIITVDEKGNITAMKHGTAIVTATVDTISRSCEIIVEPPDISLSADELTLNTGASSVLTAKVSSGNQVLWSSSNSNICSVDESGRITAWQKGKAYIYASEDGTKVRCVVHVTEKE